MGLSLVTAWAIPGWGTSGPMEAGCDREDQWIVSPEGISYVNPSTFIMAMVEYQILFRDSDKINDQISDGRWVYTIGIGFRW
jgi:hypothetical protein